VTPIAIALAVVGLAAVLAAWSLGARWLAVTAARGKAADVEAVRAEAVALVGAVALDSGAMQVRLDVHAAKLEDLEEQLRKARVARLGAR
jgi:hypothetical protein